MSGSPKKLVLAVVDALKPEMLERAIEHGRAPVMAKIRERGTYVRDCASSFPSVTPVAAASIATGVGPDEHFIPSMNWYHRGERRYVEYGSSFEASRAFGVIESLIDVYAEGIALVLAALAIYVEPVGYAALVVFAFLIIRSRGEGAQKYGGLRILR